MFKFDFKVDNDDEQSENVDIAFKTANSDDDDKQKQVLAEKAQINDNNKNSPLNWYDAVEVMPTSQIYATLDYCELHAKEVNFGKTSIRHVVSGSLLEDIKTHAEDADSEDIRKSEQSHSDLLPGVYEGGAKIWECTDDLLNYLAENYNEEFWQNKHVLDLGCGSGLLGIYAQLNGATVHYQDYNRDVLEKITIPNVLLNITNEAANEELPKETKFYAGDWSNYATLTEAQEKFDIILTSETIYNPENQTKLLDTFAKRLKSSDGLVLVAAKTYYFGVGGGLRQFETLITNDKRFKSAVLWNATSGISREIIELKYL